MINKVLAIQNCGPSGTTLLQSLLDGHPQILTLPGLHGQQLLVFWDKYHHLGKKELYSKFIEEFAYYYDQGWLTNDLGLKELGDNRDEVAIVDKDAFFHYLTQLWNVEKRLSRKQFIVSIYIAYNKALGRDQNLHDCYLLYPIHSLKQKYASYLIEDFNEVKFLHTIREPLQSMGSAAKHINKYEHWDHLYLLSCITAQMIADFTLHVGPHDVYGMRPYFPDKKDNTVSSRALRLEDIHLKPKQVLTSICKWLGINWSETLLQSTFNGKTWHNRPESIRQVGFGTQVISQSHQDILSAFDRVRLRCLSMPFQEHFGYQTNCKVPFWLNLLMPFLLCLPFKMELLYPRLTKQLGRLRAQKTHSSFLKIVPKRLDKLIVIGQHGYGYVKCRLQWLLPLWFQSKFSKPINYIKLLDVQ